MPHLPDVTSEPEFKIVKTFLEVTVVVWDQAPIVSAGSFEWYLGAPGKDSTPQELLRAPTLFTMTPQFKMIYSATWTPFLCQVEDWEIPYFNLDLVKGWLSHCERDHGYQCTGLMKNNRGFAAKFLQWRKLRRSNCLPSLADLPRGFRIICTKEWKVMQPKDHIRYVALSYLWSSGTDSDAQLERGNISALELPGGLSSLQIPNIIRDAIILCQQLDEPYLWIDRFCIIQDEPEAKLEQIKAMDSIYRSASLTIVLALNIRDPVGLPGFNGCPRHSRASALSPCLTPCVELQGFRDTSQDFIDTLVNSSVWNKRGWTFQERLLSHRCLYITDSQVIFECSMERGIELLTWELAPGNADSGRAIRPKLPNLLAKMRTRRSSVNTGREEYTSCVKRNEDFRNIRFTIGQKTSISDYCSWVGDFTSRQLSFETDILHAFQGVANALSTSFGNTTMLFGLPERFLDDSLIWRTLGIPSRRAGVPQIPSWSWASSLEAVHYEDYYKASIVIFHYQDPDLGRRRMLDVQGKWVRHHISIQALAKQDELPELSGLQYLPGNWRTNRDWKECPHNPWQVVAHHKSLDTDACAVAAQKPGSLVFNSTVASLKIDLRAPGRHHRPDSNYDAVLRSVNGDIVGKLFLSCPEWIIAQRDAKGNTRLFDTVVVSGGLESKQTRGSICFDGRFSDIWLLNIILVERLQSKPFVAQRLAVGTITMSKWRECNPRWETVVLC